MVRRSTRKGAQKEPGFFKDSLYRVGKYANSGPRKNGTGTEKPRYAQPDGLTGEGLFADLETSYVGTVPSAPPRKLGKRQPRWQHQGPSPITEKWKVPLGWNDREPDLDPRDLDAQIERCNERIADGIMPVIFEWKLKDFVRRKEEQDKVKASEPLLSDLNVIKRLDTLKRILKSLEEGDDPYEMKENVKTLINGYRSKSLEWHNGLVIYLSHGKQISQPRRYTYKEHLQIAKRYEGHKGFWVEGSHRLNPHQTLIHEITESPLHLDDSIVCHMYISLRVPGAHPTCWQAFECVDDTASDIMLINQCDVDLLVNMGSPFPALSSIIETTLADGTTALIPVILLEANIHKRTPVPTATGGDLLYPNGTTVYQNIAMTEWTEIQVAVNLPWPPVSRLNGPFVRQKLYTATNPTGEPLMHIFDRKGEFAREVPSVNGRRRAVPQLF